MHDVIGPTFRHVTSSAILRWRVIPDRHRVALLTNARVVPARFLASRNVVRIVTGGARHRATAFQKAARLSKPVRRSRNFEFVVMTAARRMIKMNHVVGEWLSRLV